MQPASSSLGIKCCDHCGEPEQRLRLKKKRLVKSDKPKVLASCKLTKGHYSEFGCYCSCKCKSKNFESSRKIHDILKREGVDPTVPAAEGTARASGWRNLSAKQLCDKLRKEFEPGRIRASLDIETVRECYTHWGNLARQAPRCVVSCCAAVLNFVVQITDIAVGWNLESCASHVCSDIYSACCKMHWEN